MAVLAGYCAVELAGEGLVRDTNTMFQSAEATANMQLVNDELEVFVGVLLVVTSESLRVRLSRGFILRIGESAGLLNCSAKIRRARLQVHARLLRLSSAFASVSRSDRRVRNGLQRTFPSHGCWATSSCSQEEYEPLPGVLRSDSSSARGCKDPLAGLSCTRLA